MKYARPTYRAGFTLIEVLVALVILAVGILAIMQLFPSALRQTKLAAERTTVANLASTELGRLRAGGVGHEITQWAQENALRALTDAERAYALYDSWRASVQRIGGDVDLFRVTFRVQLIDGREEQFVTYVTDQ